MEEAEGSRRKVAGGIKQMRPLPPPTPAVPRHGDVAQAEANNTSVQGYQSITSGHW